MSPEEQRFESWKYSRRISLISLGDGLFGLAGPGLTLLKTGELEELIPDIKELAYRLAVNPRAAKPMPRLDLTLDYLTDLDI